MGIYLNEFTAAAYIHKLIVVKLHSHNRQTCRFDILAEYNLPVFLIQRKYEIAVGDCIEVIAE